MSNVRTKKAVEVRSQSRKMATRKKADDKNLKILRELVSLPKNKQCFDCHQRGPTYVNMTIGSYVCTTCSGMLRGLTPPHRVKSISMASFNQEELELMKARGNEYCRSIWLGLYDSNSQDTKDEQQIKDFMIAKYEKKRYYLDPTVAGTVVTPVAVSKNGGSSSSFSPVSTRTISPPTSIAKIDAKPFSALLGSQSKNLVLNMQTSTSAADNMFTPDKSPGEFLADFGSADPFSSSTQFTPTSSNQAQASFANFDDNPIFNSFTSHMFGNVMRSETIMPRVNTNRWSMPTSATLSNMYNAATFPSPSHQESSSAAFQQHQLSRQQPPVEDRYAALKDLDSLMKTHQSPEPAPSSIPQANNGFGVTAFGSPSQNSGVGMHATYPDTPAVNPFTGASANPWGAASVSNNHTNNTYQPAAYGMNPFQTPQTGYAPAQADPWSGIPNVNGMPTANGHNGGLFTTSQSMNFPAKTWHNHQTANPFMLGTSPASAGHSSNPFL